MCQRAILSGLCLLALTGCGPKPLYWTTNTEAPSKPDDVLITPYFTKLTNRITVSIASGAPQTDQSGNSKAAPLVLAVTSTPVPTQRSYLYMHRDDLYNDAINVTVSANGMLSSSDTASVQQVTAILTELAQTVGELAAPRIGPLNKSLEVASQTQNPLRDDRQKTSKDCFDALKDLVSNYSFYYTFDYDGSDYSYDGASQKTPPGTIMNYAFAQNSRVSFQLDMKQPLTIPTPPPNSSGDGLIAFDPTPVTFILNCTEPATNVKVQISPPIALQLYLTSRRVNPQRDGLRNTADTYTFSEGIVTGHKFSEQSPVKTIVDTITSPIRALTPSVSVQTQVQTGGGKPDQTTTTTSVGAPKSN